MKKASFFAILISLWPGAGLAQSIEDLVNDGKNTDNVTTQSMGYDRKSYSPLKQINKSNVKRLVPIWNLSLMNDMGELAAPVIYQNVMYAINGKCGALQWRSSPAFRVRRTLSPGGRRRSMMASCFA